QPACHGAIGRQLQWYRLPPAKQSCRQPLRRSVKADGLRAAPKPWNHRQYVRCPEPAQVFRPAWVPRPLAQPLTQAWVGLALVVALANRVAALVRPLRVGRPPRRLLAGWFRASALHLSRLRARK